MDFAAEVAFPERERLVKLYREQIGAYKSVNAELADLEWTLADVERQIGSLREQSDAAGAAASAWHLRDLEHWKNALEEGVLQRMYRAEALATAIAQLHNELDLQAAPEA